MDVTAQQSDLSSGTQIGHDTSDERQRSDVEMTNDSTKEPTSTDSGAVFPSKLQIAFGKTLDIMQIDNDDGTPQTAQPLAKCLACGLHNLYELLLDEKGRLRDHCAICASINHAKATIDAYVVTNPPKPFHPQYKTTVIKEECDRIHSWVGSLRKLGLTAMSYQDVVQIKLKVSKRITELVKTAEGMTTGSQSTWNSEWTKPSDRYTAKKRTKEGTMQAHPQDSKEKEQKSQESHLELRKVLDQLHDLVNTFAKHGNDTSKHITAIEAKDDLQNRWASLNGTINEMRSLHTQLGADLGKLSESADDFKPQVESHAQP